MTFIICVDERFKLISVGEDICIFWIESLQQTNERKTILFHRGASSVANYLFSLFLQSTQAKIGSVAGINNYYWVIPVIQTMSFSVTRYTDAWLAINESGIHRSTIYKLAKWHCRNQVRVGQYEHEDIKKEKHRHTFDEYRSSDSKVFSGPAGCLPIKLITLSCIKLPFITQGLYDF